jgi:hypothetical protein
MMNNMYSPPGKYDIRFWRETTMANFSDRPPVKPNNDRDQGNRRADLETAYSKKILPSFEIAKL